jgi:hypothetical protein
MSRTCIICGDIANSGEHIFPAALGGRRVNRGIYCGAHNNGFSELANVLSRQLAMVNALLGVRPDHADLPRILNVTTPTGDEVIVSAGSVARASTSLVAGRERIHLQLVLGGPEGLRAIGYVALTFFAHCFRDEARQAGLTPIKAFIQGQSDNEFVWWESEATTSGLTTNPFEFGHTIVLTTSPATGEAMALVSLFQCLKFGIQLGWIENTRDRTVVVFIDPHADHPPADMQQRASDAVEFRIQKPEPLHAHLEQFVREGRGQELLQGLFARIEQWKFRTEMAPVLDGLNAAAALPAVQRLRAIQAIVEEQGTRVYRLMDYVARDFHEKHAGQAEFHLVLAARLVQVELNEERGGLGEQAESAFARAVAAIIAELNKKLSEGAIDMDYLWLLFSGGCGAHIVAESMFRPLADVLSNPASWGGNET